MPDRVVTYDFRGKFGNLAAGLTAQGRNVAELGTKLTALDKNGRQLRAGLTSVGDTAGRVGLVAAAGLAVVIGVTANFEKAMSRAGAATRATGADLDALRAAAIAAGAETVFSASEAADGITELGKAGLSTADILGGGLAGALDLAAAGQISVAEAAETTAVTLQQFGLEGDKATHVADVLAASAGKAMGDVTDMSGALKYVGPVAAQMGVSLEQTAGSIALLASQGVLGEQAGTSLRGMLTSLTSPSKAASEQMEALGINMYDASGQFVGLDGIAGQLKESMSTLGAAERDQALGRIFGNEQITAARILYAGGAEDVRKWTEQVNDSGYAADQAAKLTDNLAGDVEQLKGSLETALIGAGSGSQGAIRSMVQDVTGVVNAFNAAPPAIQGTATKLLALTAITGGALWFGSKVINGVASTKEALDQLGISAGKSKTALAGIGKGFQLYALIEGINLLDDAFDDLFDRNLNESNLNRGLTALADGRTVDNLGKIGGYVRDINAAIPGATDTVFGFLPGDTTVSKAREEIEKVDQALASMVESGNAEQAADAFAQITEQARDQDVSVSDINKTFGEYQLAVKNAADEGGPFADVMEHVSTATSDFGTAARAAAVNSEKMAEATEKSRDAARTTAKAFVGLGDSLSDSKVSLGDWIADLRSQADALRDFRVNAETAANKGLRQGLINALREAGPEGALRMKQLAGATKEQIAQANAAWKAGQTEVRKYTNEIGGVPRNVNTDVNINTGSAMSKLQSLRDAIGSIPAIPSSIAAPKGKKKKASADGGTVPKTGLPYADRHEYLLADGERVTSNRYGQSDKATHLLDLINDGKLTDKMVGYADGGTAGRRPGKAAGKAFTVGGTTPDGFYQVSAGKSVAGTVGALTFMQTIVKSLNGDLKILSQQYREAEKAIKRETRGRDAIAAKVATQQAEVDRLTGLFDGLSSTIQSGLAANQFADDPAADPWGSSVAGGAPTFDEILRRLNASTKDAEAFTTATGTLTANGLTGAALESVLAQGLGTASMFAGLTPEQLAQYQATFDQNAVAVGNAGTTGGDAVFGPELGRQTELLTAQQAELARANQALSEATQAANRAERARDRAEKQRDRALENQKAIRDELSEIRSEIKKARGDVESGARGQR